MTQRVETLIRDVRRKWDELGAALLPPASSTDIDDFERRFNVKMPSDFVTYLAALGGMPLGTTDEHEFRFWPLTEVQPDPTSTKPAQQRNLVFADFLICSIEYAINLSPDAHAAIFRLDGAPTKIASSFTEFLALYVDDPRNLLGRLKQPSE